MCEPAQVGEDAALSGMRKARLLADPDVQGLAIAVSIAVATCDGSVVLQGRAATREQRDRAAPLVCGSDGLEGVRHELTLRRR